MKLSCRHECPASPATRRFSRIATAAAVSIVLVGRCLCAAQEAEGRAEARQWFARHFGADSRQAPFSFVYGDRPSGGLLPTWQTTTASDRHDSVRTERKLVWMDRESGLQVTCVAVEYADSPAVEWTVYFKNTGRANTPILQHILALDETLQKDGTGEFVLNGISGDWSVAESYAPYRLTLGANDIERFAPRAGPDGPESGKSSDGPRGWPYFNLQSPGGGTIIAVGWPGQWAATFARDASTGLKIEAGQELTHLYLKPGEEIRTPLIAMLFWKGADLSRAQNLWRRWYIADNEPKVDGIEQQPIAEITVGGGKEDIPKLNELLEAGVKIDNCWRDAMNGELAWFPTAGGPYHKSAEHPEIDAWWNSGTWDVDPGQFPEGFRPFTDWVHAHGLTFMLWFEPERVGSPNSWLAKNHPEWLLPPKSATYGIHPSHDPILDEGNPVALSWLIDHIDALIKSQGIDWYREDMNGGGPCPAWRANDSVDRQGITENHYVRGHLAFWDELRRRNPHLRIDSCASGGRRNDLETMRRAVPLWRTDYTGPAVKEMEGNQSQTYGLSSWLPFNGSYSWFDDPYRYRSVYAPSFGIEGGLKVRQKAYAEWRGIARNMLGDYYPLTPYSLRPDQWMAWQFDRPDLGEGDVQVFRRPQCVNGSIRLQLHGLDAVARYEVENLDGGTSVLTGGELMGTGLEATAPSAPAALVFTYRRQR
jgi:alpha-galactosidase